MADSDRKCRLTDLAKTPVVAKDTGRKLGTVKDVIYDPNAKQLDAVTLESRGFVGPSRWFLLQSDIQSVGSDAVMVETAEVLHRPRTVPHQRQVVREGVTLIGKSVMSESGTLLGRISDVIIDPHTGKASRYEISGGALRDVQAGRRSFPVPQAMLVGHDALIVPDSVEQQMAAEEPGGLAGAYKGTAEGAAGYGSRIRQWWDRTSRGAAKATAERESQFALGKTAGSTVLDDYGNVIVDEGEQITDDTVRTAKASGKLHQLALAAGWGATRGGYEAARQRITRATEDREQAYVIGKEVDQTIYDEDGSVILWTGAVVTQETAAEARRAGKLHEVAQAVASSQMKTGSRNASEEAQGWLNTLKEKTGAAGTEMSQRKLSSQQRSMAQGQVSAVEITDREGNIVIREGEIFTPMMLAHLEEEDLLNQIHLKPTAGPEHAAGQAGAPCIELIVKAEESHPREEPRQQI